MRVYVNNYKYKIKQIILDNNTEAYDELPTLLHVSILFTVKLV